MSALRFENRAPITVLDDRTPIAKPAEREVGKITASASALIATEPLYVLAVPGPQPARDVNALDEVPDSSWFENRIGVHELSAAQVLRGPGSGGPDRSQPLRVLSAKQAGTAPGLFVEDAAGARFILKFDPFWPETETGAEIVVQRLLWAAGYHVPDNELIDLQPAELVVGPDATQKDALGDEHPFTPASLAKLFARLPPPRANRYRVLASRLLPGEPIGGFAQLGVRADDPNDRIAHELRRSVRAQQVFFAWLHHTDVKEANTLDSWIEQPAGSGRGYVVHYLLDFGKALGVWGRSAEHEADGWAAQFDYGYAWRSLLAFGLWHRPWEGVRAPALPGVGRYEARCFDPASYRPSNPYAPFLYADRRDGFWAAKIIARIRPDHVAAAVAAARYSDPRARRYLITTLLARQRKLLRHWFAQVAPIDRFTVRPRGRAVQLCAVDLGVAHKLASQATTRYRVRSYGYDGDALGVQRVARGGPGGAVCLPELPLDRGRRDAYTLIALETWRGPARLPDLVVHVARSPADGQLRVIGLERR